MSKKELIRLAENELSQYDVDDYEILDDGSSPRLYWRKGGKKNDLFLPKDNANPRSRDNFRTQLKRQLESAGIPKLDSDKIHVLDQIRKVTLRQDALDERFDMVSGESQASTEMVLDLGPRVEHMEAFLSSMFSHFANGAAKPKMPMPEPEPEPERKVVPLQRPEPPRPIEQPEPERRKAAKGLEALEPVRNEKWARVVAQIDNEFEIDDLEGRVLYFLHECGPASPHDLKVSGLWRSTDSATRFLNDLEAKKWTRYLVAQKQWGITNEGIAALADAEEDFVEPVAPVPLVSTEAMLSGYSPPAPVLSIVPKQPRILPVTQRSMPPGLSVVDELLIYLYWNGPKTTKEMRAEGVRGYEGTSGDKNDVASAASMARGSGYVHQEQRYGPWQLTAIGRTQAMRVLGETNKQFVQK